jgi:hypothetical protein
VVGGELELTRGGTWGGERSWLASGAATTVALATIGAVLVSFMVWMARDMAPMPVPFGRTPVGVLGLVLSPICYAAVGGVLAAKLHRNPIGWLFLAAGAALGMMLPVNIVVAAAHETFRPASDAVVAVAWMRTAFATPTVVTTLVLAALIFPEGRPLAGWWRLAAWGILGGGALLVFGVATDPHGLMTYPTLPNPFGLPADLQPVATGARLGGLVVLVAGIGIALASMWRRYRLGHALLRAQLRWIVLAAGLTAASSVPFLVASYGLRVDDATGEVLAAVSQVGLCSFPVAAAFAISRYRLFDIDAVISRTLVYVPLMALLGGMYTAGIALFQRLFVAFTGKESETAIVGAILVVASAFTPLRRSLEGVVDRRFSQLKHRPTAHDGSDAPRDLRPVEPPALRSPVASAPAPPKAMPQHVSLAQVDPEGRVACPLGPGKTLRDCLRCPQLVAFVDEPDLAVVCQAHAAPLPG